MLIKLTHHDETKERAHDSQIVRAKENLKSSLFTHDNTVVFLCSTDIETISVQHSGYTIIFPGVYYI